MNRGLSLWLDVLRVGATLLVVLSHAAYDRFTRGDYQIIRDLNLGSDAVIVFFVISGLVIAMAAERDGSPGVYCFNRLTRLLSVLLPAIVLTYALDQIGQRLDPSAYPARFYKDVPLSEMLARGVTMSNEWALLDRVRLGTNGPLWSLSYEAAYYVLFGVAVFASGARRIAMLIVLACIFGPRVLLLIPAWLMGVALWHYVKLNRYASLSLRNARLLAFGTPLAYASCLATNVPETLAQLTADAFAPAQYRIVLVFSDEFLWNTLIGAFTALHVIGMARLVSDHKGDNFRVRWWAGASFSIYVTHYPMLHLIDAAFAAETLARDLLLVAGPIAVGLLFAQMFERPLGTLRAVIRSMTRTPYSTGRQQNPSHPPASLLQSPLAPPK